ncbi:sodium:alanine symporter family protein [Clostridium tagluense]|uniref:alanine/glycine:cation symporter family protein n=1 Tax=Clostridium tagluense TaxID=360422 RepID=UPI001CF38A6B|nr:sodium:alanine symporter family protein [Clostridium tagluense]MCB2313566.1 sodium:alanine symporter family protein [Clostridium tagluense]MCB2318430.1 sodium:alanine symporter family protein [Clostridium tagluense]MCB2323231.1 sodium:alanine symporter family protein [Clostridium tagluense]MCB2328174.1 sodium:alanine symporter family protein [Clostridium tagluense]MCB2332961.1 sodium:alanine symporter family protein [Clostridium tagluense]
MESFGQLIAQIDSWIWGIPLIVLLFGTHLFLTFRLKFIQRYIFKAVKLSVTKDDFGVGDVSQFSALTTALAATIGTGNIVGVATAVGLGGPGAVLWCWLTGVFGIATKYSESLLSVKYRVKTKDGTMAGGPMYVLEHALNAKWAGVLFAVFTSIAAFGIGCMVQANSVSSMVYETFKIPTWATGLVIAVLVAVVILGGIKKIAKVCDILVPFMAIFYVIGCIILLAIGYKTIGSTIVLIFKDAFSPQAAAGGFAGAGVMMAMRYGVSRGLFSNESGLGSAPIVAAAAQTRNPVKQALVSATGTFWDTVVVCAMTGLVIVNSGLWQEGVKGAALTKGAFAAIPVVGPIILTVGLLTFVFSTILGWSYYGEKAIEYLLGKKAILPYRILWVIFVYVGSVFSLNLVWDLADLFNGLMALPNLIALIVLSPVIVSETKKYLWDDNLEAIDTDPIRQVDEKGNSLSM